MFRGIYRHIWTENITTTVVWWLCCQSVELIVTSSTPESEVSGGRGDAQEPVGGWMTVHLKSQGTPRQDSVVFSGLRRLVICLREKKTFGTPLPRPASLSHAGHFVLLYYNLLIII